jgi:predicted RNase H-like nuclease
MVWIAGVDGCRAGWFVVLRVAGAGEARGRVVARFTDVLALPERPERIAIDIPIGLLDAGEPGGRACDREARRLLGPRGCTVFSPPVRCALACADYCTALQTCRASSRHGLGISRQCFNLFGKLREADAAMTPARQERLIETHPELCFYEMDGGRPLEEPKRSAQGRAARVRLLQKAGFADPEGLRGQHSVSQVKADDVLDACAACWTAERHLGGGATRVPVGPPRDARGLRMEIWR